MTLQPPSAAASTTRVVTGAKQTSSPSTSPTSSASVSSSVSGAWTISGSSGARTSRSISRPAKTWSVTTIRVIGRAGLGQRLLVERVLGEDDRPLLGDEQVLLQAHRLLEPRVA